MDTAPVDPTALDRDVALPGPAGTASVYSAHRLHRGRRNESTAARPSPQILWRRP